MKISVFVEIINFIAFAQDFDTELSKIDFEKSEYSYAAEQRFK